MAPSCDKPFSAQELYNDTMLHAHIGWDQHAMAKRGRRPLLQRQARFDSGEYFLAKEHKRPLDGLCMTTDHAAAAVSYKPIQNQQLGAVIQASISTGKPSRLASCNH